MTPVENRTCNCVLPAPLSAKNRMPELLAGADGVAISIDESEPVRAMAVRFCVAMVPMPVRLA